MSNKQRNKRRNRRHKGTSTNAEYHVYTPGVAVPRYVNHLLVPPSVEVLPHGVFKELKNLKVVVLSEGLREIGGWAFNECRALARVKLPSSLVKIGGYAFRFCQSLTTLHCREGLTEIGGSAFCACILLKCIHLPSTVTVIGPHAFAGCVSLKSVTLAGRSRIRTIGHYAFARCALECITLPTTLNEIGWSAFESCQLLRKVKLRGGILLIDTHTFEGCDSLDRVRVARKCLFITYTREGYNFNFATERSIPLTAHMKAVMITSECFYSMRSTDVSELEIAVAEILGMRLEWDAKRERLCRLLVPHERRRKKEVTSLLELGLWKAEMCRSGGTGPGPREECRVTCRAHIIIENVVPFL